MGVGSGISAILFKMDTEIISEEREASVKLSKEEGEVLERIAEITKMIKLFEVQRNMIRKNGLKSLLTSTQAADEEHENF